MKKETAYCLFLTAIYFAVSLIGILHHELWLDEAHHWLIARDSVSFVDLLKNTRYEGHPILWNLLLFWITRFTSDPFWMQFLHSIIATSVAFLFLRKAPFSLVFKVLFIFGYFMIFEYNLISRNYILGVLFVFLACSVFKERNEKFILLAVYLALAINVHAMFAVIALALFLIVVWEQIQERLLKPQFLWGYCIFGFGVILFLIQMQTTQSDWLLHNYGSIPLGERLTKGFISFYKGIIAVPDFRTLHFWNTNILVNLSKPTAAVLGLLMYLLPLFLFFKNRKTLLFVYVALFGIQIFFYLTQRGATRFDGSTYIIVIVALWIENYYATEEYRLKHFLKSLKVTLLKNQIIYSILILHFASGIYAYATDYKFEFTAAKVSVDYLKQHHLDNKEILTITCDGTSISPYLEKKVYFLCDGNYESYCHWNFSCAAQLTRTEVISMITDYMATHNEAVYVSYLPLLEDLKPNIWKKVNDKIKIRFLTEFNKTIKQKSNYYIFEISKVGH